MTVLSRLLLACCFSLLSIFWFSTPIVTALPFNSADVFNTGVNHLRQQNYQQALADFTQIIERQDNLMGAAYSNRCLANLQLDRDGAAEADCIQAIAYSTDNLEAYLNLGLAHYRQGEYHEAISQYQQVIQQDEQDYRAYYNQGLAHAALNHYHQAIIDYQWALKYSPDSQSEVTSLIHNDLALAYLMSAQDEPAIFNLERAIALNSSNYQAFYNRGCVYHGQGKYQAAIADFSQAVALKPDFAPAYVHRGILNHQLGAVDTAFSDLNLALKQYQNQGNQEQYNLVSNLKQQLFAAQPSKLV